MNKIVLIFMVTGQFDTISWLFTGREEKKTTYIFKTNKNKTFKRDQNFKLTKKVTNLLIRLFF